MNVDRDLAEKVARRKGGTYARFATTDKDLARGSARSGGWQPGTAGASRLYSPAYGRCLQLPAAGRARAPQAHTDRARGDGPRRWAGSTHACAATKGTLGKAPGQRAEPRRNLRAGSLHPQGPAWTRHRAWPDARGGRHLAGNGVYPQLSRPAPAHLPD